MECDLDDFYEPPPGMAGEAVRDADFFASPPPSPERVRSGGHAGRPREPPKSGDVGVWVISVETRSEASSSSAGPCELPASEIRRVEGLGTIRWTFKEVVRGAADGADGIWGRLEYAFTDLVRLAHPWEAPPDLPFHAAIGPRRLEMFLRGKDLEDGRKVVALLDASTVMFEKCVEVPRPQVGAGFCADLPYVVHTMALGRRISPRSIMLNSPPMSSIARWRRELGVVSRGSSVTRRGARPPTSERVLLEVPTEPKKRQRNPSERQAHAPAVAPTPKLDPLKSSNAVAFSLHLRQVSDFSEALSDARRYDANDSDDDSVERDATRDPQRSSLQRAARRVDIVGMGVERGYGTSTSRTMTCYALTVTRTRVPSPGPRSRAWWWT